MGGRRGWREFRHGWVRYLAVLLLVALGVAVVLAMVVNSAASLSALERSRIEGALADGEFTTVAPLSAGQRGAIERLGVRLEEADRFDLTRRSGSGTVQVRALALSGGLNRPLVEEGTLPERPGTVMVEKLHARASGLALGDRIELAGRTLVVVGTGSVPHYAYPVAEPTDVAADPSRFGVLVVSSAELDALAAAEPGGVHHTYAYVLRGATEARLRGHLQRLTVAPDLVRNPLLRGGLKRAASAGTPASYPALTEFLPSSDNLRVSSALQEAAINQRVALGAGAMVLLLVGYVLAAFSRDQIERESATIGTLYALGFTRGELVRGYLGLPVALTAGGAALGTAVGQLWAPTITETAQYYSMPPLDYAPQWASVAGGVLAPVVLVGAVNLMTLRRQLSKSPLELIRPVPSVGPGSRVGLPRLGFHATFRVRQALRSLDSYGLLATGLTLAVLLLVFGLGVQASLRQYLSQLERDLTYEHLYTMELPDLDRVPPGAHPATALPMKVIDEGAVRGDVTLLGVDADERYVGSPPVARLGPLEVVASDAVAIRYGVGVGDQLVLREAEGELNRAFTVVAITPYSNGLLVFTSRAQAQEVLDPALVELTAALSSDGWLAAPGRRPPSTEPVAGRFYNALFSDASLALDAHRLGGEVRRDDVLAGVRPFNDLMAGLITTIVATSLVLFVIVLYVLVRMIVGRQRYPIALMKAFGYSEREVARVYLGNYLWLLAVVLAVAVPASTVVLGPLWLAMLSNVPMGVPFVLPASSALAVVGLALVSYAAVRWLAARDTRAVGVHEVLKLRE